VLDTGLQRSPAAQQQTTVSPFPDLMLQEHQSPAAFTSFDDRPNGFYTVFNALFKNLHSQESSAAEESGEKLSVQEAPLFGTSGASEREVKEFYAYWSSFQTVKSFAWLDLHDPQSGVGRRMRRLLESENNKVRKAAKIAFVKDVRNLVDWVRGEDKRVQKARVCCCKLACRAWHSVLLSL
jgi:DnaJ homolog subfamily A member 5